MKIRPSTIFIVYCSIFIQQILARYLLVEIDSKQPITTKGPLKCIDSYHHNWTTCSPPYDDACLYMDKPSDPNWPPYQRCEAVYPLFVGYCLVPFPEDKGFLTCFCDTDLCNAFCEPIMETCNKITKINPILESLLTKDDLPHIGRKVCKANCTSPLEKAKLF